MSMVKESIDIDVPVGAVYNQWTQFEEFPRFMEGVEEVRQIDDRHCHWRTKVAGAEREFDTEIVDQLPDERISWRSVTGDVEQKGVVTFQSLDDAHTRVSLAMDFEPQGMAEKAGDALGVLDRRVKGDLKRFKGFIEERGQESGGWRGRIAPTDAGTASSTGTATPGGTSPEDLRRG
ncbi:SRPBCC family protein [Streptomyces sp. NPDC048550]|uniref:SRPBCC family protein n=1 Tax=unclassified Streptomyces TaxID=2593676 RepID=UPI003421B49C